MIVSNGGLVNNVGTLSGGAGGAGGAPGYAGAAAGANGAAGYGVYLANGGSVINGSGAAPAAVISGAIGVYAGSNGGATVTNYGTITGTAASVEFQGGSSDDRLIAEAGSHFIGDIFGGSGTLELAGGTGTISGVGGFGALTGAVSANFLAFATYQFDAGGSWTMTGANDLGILQSVSNQGTLTIATGASLTVSSGAFMTDSGPLINIGTIDIGGGGELFAGLNFSGGATLSGGGIVSLAAAGYIGGSGALTNLDNTIEGGGVIKGVTLTNDGTINNDVGRMLINTGGTVTNGGIIESTGTGILLVRNTTIDSSGGRFVTDSSRLQLSNATIFGGLLTINTGALLINDTLGGTVNLSGGTVHNAGTIEATTGGLTIDGAVLNNGLIEAVTGKLVITGGVTGSGTARLRGKGNLEIDGAVSENIFFAKNSTGILVLGDVTTLVNGVTGRIYGLANNGANHIDLKNLTFATGDTAKFTGSAVGGTLTIYNSSNVAQASLKLSGHYLGSTFTVTGDGSGGTLITDPAKTTQLSQAMAAFGLGGAGAATAAAVLTAPPTVLVAAHG